MSKEEYFGKWLDYIDTDLLNTILVKLNNLYENKVIYPKQTDIFKAFRLCKYEKCSIIFLGLDPYPNNKATGVLFGNSGTLDYKDWSPSLKIVKDGLLSNNVSYKSSNFDPTLENWAKQGILMLNSALTVEANKIGSHSLMWRPFISKFLNKLSFNNPSLIYVLFGNVAQSFCNDILKSNYVFKAKHPAYYARTGQQMPNIFININEKLKQINGNIINWYGE